MVYSTSAKMKCMVPIIFNSLVLPTQISSCRMFCVTSLCRLRQVERRRLFCLRVCFDRNLPGAMIISFFLVRILSREIELCESKSLIILRAFCVTTLAKYAYCDATSFVIDDRIVIPVVKMFTLVYVCTEMLSPNGKHVLRSCDSKATI